MSNLGKWQGQHTGPLLAPLRGRGLCVRVLSACVGWAVFPDVCLRGMPYRRNNTVKNGNEDDEEETLHELTIGLCSLLSVPGYSREIIQSLWSAPGYHRDMTNSL